MSEAVVPINISPGSPWTSDNVFNSCSYVVRSWELASFTPKLLRRNNIMNIDGAPEPNPRVNLG